MFMKGRLIVIDGADGSGKATQTALLSKRLKKSGKKVIAIDFPRYYDNFFGAFIGECLAGRHGNFLAKDPYVASVLYAADRFESSNRIKEWLNKGYIVIADRYVSGNQIHQGGKIGSGKRRRKFLNWLDMMEHKIFAIPRPDVIFYLDVPERLAHVLSHKKTRKKKYLRGKKDVAEENVSHQRRSRRAALLLVREFKNWVKIECARKGKMFSREYIHEQIFSHVSKRL